MNPSITEEFIQAEVERDPEAARSEWFAEFREDIEAAFTIEAIEQCVIPGRTELLPAQSLTYAAFVDPSGGRRDQFTVAVGHRSGDKAVVDMIKAWKPPFDPREVVKECVDAIKPYRIRTITGDNYGGEWPVAEFRKHGVSYQLSNKNRSELYLAMIPVVNSKSCELPYDRRMIDELRRLERRRGRTGKDSIDHPAHSSDDLANSIAGVINLIITKASVSKNAVPIGVGNRGIGSEIRRTFGSTLSKPLLDSTFGPAPEERLPNTGCATLFRLDWGPDNSEDKEPGGYISQTGRRNKFPSMD